MKSVSWIKIFGSSFRAFKAKVGQQCQQVVDADGVVPGQVSIAILDAAEVSEHFQDVRHRHQQIAVEVAQTRREFREPSSNKAVGS